MKTLYESILDSEDILLTDTKNIVNDPLTIIHEMFKNNEDQSRILELIDNGLLDGFLMDNFYIDRKKLGLKCEIDVYTMVVYLRLYYLVNSSALIIFKYHKSRPTIMSLKYISKDELSSDNDFTPIMNSKFYKQHNKIQSNLKELGYEKTKTYDDEFIHLTKTL